MTDSQQTPTPALIPTRVRRRSPFTGEVHERTFMITHEQAARYASGTENIQDIFPEMDPADREFILTGITPEEWDTMLPQEDV